jgi:D-arabinitol dehydrogenase (NADP+)
MRNNCSSSTDAGKDHVEAETEDAMRAAIIQEPGIIRIRAVETPRVTMPDEVLVKSMASGICGAGVDIYRGEYLGSYPMTPGHEFYGVVEAAGPGMRRVK